MVTDEDVKKANDQAEDAKANARQVRQQAINEHYEAAYDERKQAEELE